MCDESGKWKGVQFWSALVVLRRSTPAYMPVVRNRLVFTRCGWLWLMVVERVPVRRNVEVGFLGVVGHACVVGLLESLAWLRVVRIAVYCAGWPVVVCGSLHEMYCGSALSCIIASRESAEGICFEGLFGLKLDVRWYFELTCSWLHSHVRAPYIWCVFGSGTLIAGHVPFACHLIVVGGSSSCVSTRVLV